MAAWHPFADEALGALAAQGIEPAVALPLYPHESRTTTGSSLNQLEHARARQGGAAIEIAAIKRYPDADGYVRAVAERVEEAIATLPAEHRATAPVMFSAHGLPEAYIKRGDPYLDDVRITVETVSRRLALGARARLCFQSRVGPQRWLGPTTEAVLDELAAAGTPAVVVSRSRSRASTSRRCRRSTSSTKTAPRRPASCTSRAPAPSAATRRSSPRSRIWSRRRRTRAAGPEGAGAHHHRRRRHLGARGRARTRRARARGRAASTTRRRPAA